jgi:DHA2 family methylenomycin A resistance protein-like MFS transporter
MFRSVAPPTAADLRAPGDRGVVALVGICLGFFVVLLDATIVNVSLPAIGSSLGGSLSDQQWILNAYTLTFAAFMLNAGAFGDRWGARQGYLGGLAIFAVATVACACAPTVAVLIAARAVQGIGAAALVPCSLALIAHRFPESRARARALGAWGGISGIGLAAGPALGGVLVDSIGWRAVFLVAVPVALVSGVMIVATVRETPRRPRPRADLRGQVLAVIALAAITAAFTTTSAHRWGNWQPLTFGIIGLGLAVAFVMAERATNEAMLPLGMFESARFSIATAIGGLFNFGLYGTLFCLALYLEHTLHRSAQDAGLAILPLAAVVVGCATLSGHLNARFGARLPMLIGLLAGVIGAGLLATCGAGTPLGAVMAFAAIFGMIGAAMPAMTAVALDASLPGRAALGSAVLNTARQIGGLLGVAVLGSVLEPHGALPTLHVAMAIVACGYLTAALLATRISRDPTMSTPKPESANSRHPVSQTNARAQTPLSDPPSSRTVYERHRGEEGRGEDPSRASLPVGSRAGADQARAARLTCTRAGHKLGCRGGSASGIGVISGATMPLPHGLMPLRSGAVGSC